MFAIICLTLLNSTPPAWDPDDPRLKSLHLFQPPFQAKWGSHRSTYAKDNAASLKSYPARLGMETASARFPAASLTTFLPRRNRAKMRQIRGFPGIETALVKSGVSGKPATRAIRMGPDWNLANALYIERLSES
ncbi:hypothetical protein [Labrys sp. WJW]|uniref:hypothetical protein n=1 Tax=Labrys sp. WJW TaxID=1737983 RepID=UPI0012E99DAF|nr:hypothetical protein [Labrys sp. WJW]